MCIRDSYYTTLRKNYTKITQIVYAQHAIITQISLRRHYTNIFCLRNNITQSLRKLRIITQIHYADITQIYYANHYADYAIITQLNYANQIMQSP